MKRSTFCPKCGEVGERKREPDGVSYRHRAPDIVPGLPTFTVHHIDPAEPRSRCNQCTNRMLDSEVFKARRHGGGNWRRAGRLNDATICAPCARRMIETATPGHGLNDRWDVSGLIHRLKRHEDAKKAK